MLILDVSNWNDIQSFSGIKKKYEGVICKASEGVSFKDPTFNWKIENLIENGIKCGAYHFITKTSDPCQQAREFWNTIKGYEMEIIPCLDVEQNGITERIIDEFVNEFRKLSNVTPLIYSYKSYIENNFSITFRKKYLWWFADYTSKERFSEGCKIVMWQYSETEVVEGILGNCDVSKVYDQSQLFINSYHEEVPFEPEFDEEYEEHGQANVIVDGLRIRRYPSLKGKVVGEYYIGDSFIYDRVFHNDGFVWVRYLGLSGEFCFVAVKELANGKRFADCI